MENEASLKQLNFVPEYGCKGYSMATNVYSTAKEKLPISLKEQLTKIEEKTSSLSAPLVAQAQDKGSEILKVVDGQVTGSENEFKSPFMRLFHRQRQLFFVFTSHLTVISFLPFLVQVDKAMKSAGQVYQSNSTYIQAQLEKAGEVHRSNLESYKAAREQYLKQVEDTVEFVKKEGITGAARKAADEVSAAVAEARKLPGIVAKQVHDAFERLLSFEPVQRTLSSAKPAVDAAYPRYMGVHDTVVASPQYKKAFDQSMMAVARAQETFLYKRAVSTFYPYVAKYADPAVAQITASPYYHATVKHITPNAAA